MKMLRNISMALLVLVVALCITSCGNSAPKSYYSYELVLADGSAVTFDAKGNVDSNYKQADGTTAKIEDWEKEFVQKKFTSFTLGSGNQVTSFVNGGNEMVSDNLKITYKVNKDGLTIKAPYGDVVFEADGENYKLSAGGETAKFKEVK